MTAALDPQVPGDAPLATAPAPRCPPDRVARARLRARIMAARMARRRPAIAALGRISGRLGRDLPALPDQGFQVESPALSLLLDSNLAGRVFDAAAASLLGNFIAGAITPEAVATLPMSPEARDFALYHRHLSLMPDELRDDTRFEALRDGLVALWAEDLPKPLSHEFANGARPLFLPHQTRPPLPAPPRRPDPRGRQLLQRLTELLSPRTTIVLPMTSFPIPPDRARAALEAAMSAFLPQSQPQEPRP